MKITLNHAKNLTLSLGLVFILNSRGMTNPRVPAPEYTQKSFGPVYYSQTTVYSKAPEEAKIPEIKVSAPILSGSLYEPTYKSPTITLKMNVSFKDTYKGYYNSVGVINLSKFENISVARKNFAVFEGDVKLTGTYKVSVDLSSLELGWLDYSVKFNGAKGFMKIDTNQNYGSILISMPKVDDTFLLKTTLRQQTDYLLYFKLSDVKLN